MNAAGTAPGLRRLAPADATKQLETLLSTPYEYRDWEELYRDEWTWDRVVKVTHTRTNCLSACSLDAYVKDGLVWREEQAANYTQAFSDVPDFNPRGCTPGCVYSTQMYDPMRIKYPMKRIGARGSGKWERLTWDRALTEIADHILDVVVEDGADCIIYDSANSDFGIGSSLEGHLFLSGIGGTLIDSYAGVGDLPTGLVQSWGLYMSEGTSDDWFLSDYILLWLGNPSYTRVPDAHFLWEARYRGAKVVSIAPDFNASTMHADRWLNLRSGTDAALALGMVNVILEEDLFEHEFVKEQTDLPFLIRADNRRFLRQSDVAEGGLDDVFYFWNTLNGRKVEAPGTWGSTRSTIALDEDVDPSLEGSHRVRLKDGRRVTVRPVFEHLRRRAREYTPEDVAAITGVAEENIRRVAREFAAAESAMIYASWGACKHYHSNLFQRGMTYLCALTGNSGGRPGSGMKVGAWWPAPNAVLTGGRRAVPSARLSTEPTADSSVDRLGVQTVSKMTLQMAQAAAGGGNVSPLLPWLYAHDPKWAAAASRDDYNDPSLKRPVREYMRDILEQGWQPISPRPPKRPRFLHLSGPNPMRRWPNPKAIRESLWAQIDTIVTTDFRMSTTGVWSDYLLPACGYYEKPGIKYTSSFVPYVVIGDRAVPPLYESLHEWDITLMLAKKIQKRALERDVPPYRNAQGREFDLTRLYDEITADGTYQEGEQGEKRALDYILRNSALTRSNDLGEGAWEKAVEEGMVKIKSVQPSALIGGVFSDYAEDRPVNSCGWFVNRKNPWPTLTGRQQFYIDHPWFLELGEELAVHKEPLAAGGHYPLRLTGGHTRWSMHSLWRTNPLLLQLQRGEPVAYISVPDAEARGISDHDHIRVHNDVGAFEARAKVSPAAQPGTVIVYHAWEGYQFKEWATQNDVISSPLNPLDMVGGYGQLHYRVAGYSMNLLTKEVAVEVTRA